MPGEVQQQAGGPRPPVPEPEKRLVADYLKRIDAALDRHKDVFKTFDRNRKLLRGLSDPSNKDSPKIRANLYFSNLAAMRPQVYAKDPEYSVQPTPAVPEEQLAAVKRFGETSEAVLSKVLVKDGQLKKRSKRLLSSAYTTAIGWWKCVWQEDVRRDPLIAERLKDTQDNLQRVQALRDKMTDPRSQEDQDLQIAQLKQALEGLQAQAEVTVARGVALDFVLSEDIVILDPTVREISDYPRAAAMAHRVWMTADGYQQKFGYRPEKAKTWIERGGQMSQPDADADANKLLLVWEIWDQEANQICHVCPGEEGFCDPPSSPDWTGRRWYPFFALAFNEIDGTFYPLADVELIEPLVVEYNKSRDDLAQDRKDARPFTVVREGGNLSPEDVRNIRNRNGNDLVVVKGVPGKPLADDIQSVTLGNIDAAVYDTAPARADIEQILGGGDAARGAVLKAKTATEAEILSQGLRSRSAERTDTMEDLLGEVGEYVLQMCLRKLSPEEVKRIAGADAEWPQQLSVDEIFDQVLVTVKGGSTGKPDRLQEQDRWTNLLPVIEKAIERVSQLRMQGQEPLAQALIELTRETLRRFEENLDIEQFLPAPQEGQVDPARAIAQNEMLKQQVQELMQRVQELETTVDKGYISAATSIATAADPLTAAAAFGTALQALDARPNDAKTPPMPPEDPDIPAAVEP